MPEDGTGRAPKCLASSEIVLPHGAHVLHDGRWRAGGCPVLLGGSVVLARAGSAKALIDVAS